MQGTLRLVELLQLADRGPAIRAAVAEEVAELLIDWPGDCPINMRSACESLLAKAAREVDDTVLARLRARLRDFPDLAAFVLPPEDIHRCLMEVARGGDDIAVELARLFNLPRPRIKNILSDRSGRALAIACKARGLSRASFSALVILLSGKTRIAKIHARLDAYDVVDVSEAERLLRGWRDSAIAERAA
jgi:hypothetical protein